MFEPTGFYIFLLQFLMKFKEDVCLFVSFFGREGHCGDIDVVFVDEGESASQRTENVDVGDCG
jgi:hypothetical protein